MTDSGNSDSSSLGHAFLDLGERLRQRGQLEAAASVAAAGLARYPTLATAHDLLGRIRSDQADEVGAAAAWQSALQYQPGHGGALKGLAFLAFRRRDFATAERHLEVAAASSPDDGAVLAALDRVRSLNPGGDTSAISLDDPDGGMLLLDSQGLRLSGGTGRGDTGRLGDAAAAEAAGLSREASRTGRLLELGDWQHVMIETTTSRAVLLPVADQCSLLVIRPSLTPPGRSVTIAQRARNAAVEWLEQHG